MRAKMPPPLFFFFPNPIRNLLPLIPRLLNKIKPCTPPRSATRVPLPSFSHFSPCCSVRVLPRRASPPFASREQRVAADYRICLFPTLRTPFPCSYSS